MTETEFIKAIKEHSGIINKVIYLYVDNPEDKKDLRQEIQLQAWKAVPRFRKEAQFSTWLYRVALNTVLTFKKKRKITWQNLDKYDLHEEQGEISDRSYLLLTTIKSLNDIDKTIITLHLEDYNNGEIAEIIGLSKNHVGVKLHRIREFLKGKLNRIQNERIEGNTK